MRRVIFGIAAVSMLTSCAGGSNSVSKGEYKVSEWPEAAKCAISFTFDDDCANQLTVGVPLFAKYDRCATFYLVRDWAGDNWAAWNEAAAAGHEIGCHTVSHPNLAQLGDAEVEAQLKDCQQMLDSVIEQKHLPTLAYPFCDVPKNMKIVSDNYIAARVCDGRIEPSNPADMSKISSFMVGKFYPFNSCDSLVKLFERTREANGWCTLTFHELDNGPGYSPFPGDELDKTLAYLTNEENGSVYWVAPFAEVARYILRRNATTIEETATTADSFTFKVKTLPAIYDNEVITIERNIPEGWTSCALKESQDGTCVVADGKIIISVSAVEKDVTVVKAQ